jgi:hypothetical protein
LLAAKTTTNGANFDALQSTPLPHGELVEPRTVEMPEIQVDKPDTHH